MAIKTKEMRRLVVFFSGGNSAVWPLEPEDLFAPSGSVLAISNKANRLTIYTRHIAYWTLTKYQVEVEDDGAKVPKPPPPPSIDENLR